MVYLAEFHWGWLTGALLLGFAMGWIAVVHRGRGVTKRVTQALSVFVGALVILAVMHVVPGRFGYWLDLGLAMFGAYLVGCAIGSWLRDRVLVRQGAFDEPAERS
jgi:hypothetical protein